MTEFHRKVWLFKYLGSTC